MIRGNRKISFLISILVVQADAHISCTNRQERRLVQTMGWVGRSGKRAELPQKILKNYVDTTAFSGCLLC